MLPHEDPATLAHEDPATLPHEDLATSWRAVRTPADVIHFDAAGCAWASRGVLGVQVEHLRRESAVGGYVAQDEAATLVAGARARLGGLLGMTAPDVSLVDGATSAFALLLASWPLPAGARVGVLRTEYGSNRMALLAAAARSRLELVELRCDADGRLDLEALPGSLPGLELVTFPHVPSQRGVVQPAASAAALCRAAGVSLVLDVAQSMGQVDTAGIGATAYVGTSRKWLCGPRGLGFVATTPEAADRLQPAAPSLATHGWSGDQPARLPDVPGLDAAESSVAARVGLAVALEELLAAGPERVYERVAALGALTRATLDGRAGWRVVEPPTEPSGIVTLRPPAGADVVRVRERLHAAGVLVAAVPVARAPADLTGPVLRVSPHAYNDVEDIHALALALPAATRPT